MFLCTHQPRDESVSIFSFLGGSLWLTGMSLIKIWLRKEKKPIARFKCFAAFSSLILHRYWKQQLSHAAIREAEEDQQRM